jgi:hypothetical protein
MKVSKLFGLFLLLLIWGICMLSCSDTSSNISEKKKKLVKENREWRYSFKFNSKYDLSRVNSDKRFITSNRLTDCINHFVFMNKQINIEPFVNSADGSRESYSSIIYGNENKYYLIHLVARIYDDSESARLALENHFQGMTADAYVQDSNCSFDICFVNDERVEKTLLKKILWAKLVISYTILDDLRIDLPNKKYKVNTPKDIQMYRHMNREFFEEYSSTFEKKLLNCQL